MLCLLAPEGNSISGASQYRGAESLHRSMTDEDKTAFLILLQPAQNTSNDGLQSVSKECVGAQGLVHYSQAVRRE